MRRGRPPYPDLLTPREQQVLDLLRHGLTNRQIAERLGISLAGARYHVSEILSKLHVSTREEAAAWQPQPGRARRWLHSLALLPGSLKQLATASPLKTVSVAAIATAGAGLAILAYGTLAMSARDEASDPPEAAEATGAPQGLGKIAYVLDGDLYAMTLPNGNPVRLTDDGEASYPRWSASGEWISVADEVVRADGSERRDASGCAIWSPVADEIICHVGAGDVPTNVMRIEDASGRVLYEIDLGSIVTAQQPELAIEGIACPHWRPDGQELACVVRGSRPPPDGIGEDFAGAYSRYSGLWVVEADGSDAREVVDNYEAPVYGAVGIIGWTAEGESILFQIAAAFSASISSDGLPLLEVPLQAVTSRKCKALS